MQVPQISIRKIIDDVIDNSGDNERLDIPFLLKKANDFVDRLHCPELLVQRVALLEVKDFKVKTPRDFKSVIQVAFRDNCEDRIKREQVVEWVAKNYSGSGCDLKISLECPKCEQTMDNCICTTSEVVVEVDRIWEQAHPEYRYGHMRHFYRYGGINRDGSPYSSFNPEFRIIRYAQHNFFNADLHIKGCLNLDQKLLVNCPTEYKIELPYIKLSAESGFLLISYLALETDEQGYRFVPDLPEVHDGINYEIEAALAQREYRKRNRNPNLLTDYQRWAAMRDKKLARCREIIDTPDFANWWSFISNNWNKVYPNYKDESNMGRQTKDQYAEIIKRIRN